MIDQEIRNAILDMSQYIQYDERNHVYIDKSSGEWFQGVSSVSSIVPKDWLASWGAKEAVKFLGYSDYDDIEQAHAMLVKIGTLYQQMYEGINKAVSSTMNNKEEVRNEVVQKYSQKYQSLLKEAKSAHMKKGKQALLDGKKGHEWLELYVKSKIDGTIPPVKPTGDLLRPIQQFLDWEESYIDRWIASEAKIIHRERKYCGTFDAVAVTSKNKLALIDFKFASHISEDYHLQTAGYAAAFEPYGISFDERLILRLPKTLYIDEWDEKSHSYYKKSNDIQSFIVPTPYVEDRDAFFSALKVKSWINAYTK